MKTSNCFSNLFCDIPFPPAAYTPIRPVTASRMDMLGRHAFSFPTNSDTLLSCVFSEKNSSKGFVIFAASQFYLDIFDQTQLMGFISCVDQPTLHIHDAIERSAGQVTVFPSRDPVSVEEYASRESIDIDYLYELNMPTLPGHLHKFKRNYRDNGWKCSNSNCENQLGEFVKSFGKKRYKCSSCVDYNVCGDCFEKSKCTIKTPLKTIKTFVKNSLGHQDVQAFLQAFCKAFDVMHTTHSNKIDVIQNLDSNTLVLVGRQRGFLEKRWDEVLSNLTELIDGGAKIMIAMDGFKNGAVVYKTKFLGAPYSFPSFNFLSNVTIPRCANAKCHLDTIDRCQAPLTAFLTRSTNFSKKIRLNVEKYPTSYNLFTSGSWMFAILQAVKCEFVKEFVLCQYLNSLLMESCNCVKFNFWISGKWCEIIIDMREQRTQLCTKNFLAQVRMNLRIDDKEESEQEQIEYWAAFFCAIFVALDKQGVAAWEKDLTLEIIQKWFDPSADLFDSVRSVQVLRLLLHMFFGPGSVPSTKHLELFNYKKADRLTLEKHLRYKVNGWAHAFVINRDCIISNNYNHMAFEPNKPTIVPRKNQGKQLVGMFVGSRIPGKIEFYNSASSTNFFSAEILLIADHYYVEIDTDKDNIINFVPSQENFNNSPLTVCFSFSN